MKTLKALNEQKAALLRSMQAIIDKTSEEKDGKTVTRSLSSDEQKEFDTLETQVSDVNATIQRIKALEEQEVEPGDPQDPNADPNAAETDAQREEREAKDFVQYIRSAASGKETRDLDLGSNGAIVPKTIANKIIARVYDISPVVEQANRYMTKGTVEVPQYAPDAGNSDSDIAMAYSAEFDELTASVGAFGSVTLGNNLAGALAKVSNSLVNNTDIDVVAKIVELMAQAVARFLEKELLIGTSGKALGTTAVPAAQIVTTASATAIAADELIDLRNKVKQAFRSNGFYVFHQDVITGLEKLKDSNGQYLFNTNKAEGAWAGTFGGYKVFASDSCPTIAATARVGYFVNPGAALSLRMAPDLEIQVLRELFATSHATGVVAWVDFDTDTENTQAVSILKMHA